MICQIRKRTEPEDIAYSLYLYFLGLSLRNTSKAVSRFVERSQPMLFTLRVYSGMLPRSSAVTSLC